MTHYENRKTGDQIEALATVFVRAALVNDLAEELRGIAEYADNATLEGDSLVTDQAYALLETYDQTRDR